VPAPLLGEDDGVGALARLDLGHERGARDLDRLRALRVGGGELGLVGVKKAVDDRRGEKLCEPLQHGDFPFAVLSFPQAHCAKSRSSLPGLTRQSIHLRRTFLRRRWMRGSSPRMTGWTGHATKPFAGTTRC